MKPIRNPWLIALTLVCLLAGMVGFAQAGDLVGAKKCKICHGKKTGDQWTKWSESAHAGSFATLASQESLDIGATMGISNPQLAPECRRCHTTRGFMGPNVNPSPTADPDPDEPIACEVCHGPGSEFRKAKIMIDPVAAAAAGLVMDKSEAFCVQCHNSDSPTFKGFDFGTSWEKIAHPVSSSP